MILCVDIGNTRVKWALGKLNAVDWLETGVSSHEDLNALQQVARLLGESGSVWISNVAGSACAEHLCNTLHGSGAKLVFAQSTAHCAGVINGYATPALLGIDRWCALIAAWQIARAPSLVVSLGTATTVDALDAAGHFRGGMILPGLTLMRDSLAQRTARLPPVGALLLDEFSWPQSTEQAIARGAEEATLGAIVRAWRQLADQTGSLPRCFLTGGASPELGKRIPFVSSEYPLLVLDGLRHMANAAH